MDQAVLSLTPLPCPSCGVNLLEKGFYNHCSETTSLREDNYLYVTQGRIYVDHSEDGHETVDHECEVDARCRECDELLPWPLYEMRDLDGSTPDGAEKVIAGLLERVRLTEDEKEAQA